MGNKLDSKGQEPQDFTHMWNTKQKVIYELTKQTRINSQIKQSRGYQRKKGGEGSKVEKGVKYTITEGK